jgi:branched-chain amino acid transport system permease protein
VGVVVAAVVLGAIQPVLTNLGMSGVESAPWQYVIFGAIMVLGIRFRPAGLIPEGKRLRRRRKPAEEAAGLDSVSRRTEVESEPAKKVQG